MFHEMYLAGDPATLYAEAGAVMVWVGIGDGKSRPMPDRMRAHLTPALSTCGEGGG
jgi:acyl-CoA thioesterase FadM